MTYRCQERRAEDGAQCRLTPMHHGMIPCKFDATPKPETKKAPRSNIFRSKAESRYAEYLEGLRMAGEIVRWEYEPISMVCGEGITYKPDFMVVALHKHSGVYINGVEFHEAKGPHRFAEKGIIKLRAAAKLYPEFKFVLAKYNRGQWSIKEIS